MPSGIPVSTVNVDTAGENTGIFKCITCNHAGLRREAESYSCPACGVSYPIVLDVPLLLKGVQVRPSGFSLPASAVAPICDYLHLADHEAEARFLREVFSRRYEFGDFTLGAENNYFFNRIRVLKDLLRPPVQSDAPVNIGVHYTIEHHLVSSALPCGQAQTRNVRLRNTGSSVISSKGSCPVFLSYHWRDATGALLKSAEDKTILPIDLQPGRAVTVPTLIRTPAEPGAHWLELTLYQHGVGWLDRDSRLVGVQLVPPAPNRPRPSWKYSNTSRETYDYDKDHLGAMAMLRREVRRAPNAGRLRILEVGGCCEPMIRGLPHELYNIDIDVQTLQIGAHRHPKGLHPIQYIAADANALPFVDQSFDCIAIFAALHHFPDPAKVLSHFKQLLKPDGFLALMCEPVGSYLNDVVDEQLRAELLHGINEQIFTEEEYEEMFLQVGLLATKVVVDHGASLKAILRRRYPTSPMFRLRAWLRRRAA